MLQGRIDIHHHVIPPVFLEAMANKGISQAAGAPLLKWTPEASIAVKEKSRTIVEKGSSLVLTISLIHSIKQTCSDKKPIWFGPKG